MSNWLTPLISLLSSTTQDATVDIGTAQAEAFQAILVQEARIRLYVGTGGSVGNQAASVNLLRRLVDPVTTARLTYGYAGIVDIYYEGGQTTLDKIYSLIPELNGNPQGHVQQATVNLFDYTNHQPAGKIPFGFTGAIDSSTTDLAQLLQVDYCLQLQPYNYNYAEKIWFNGPAHAAIDLGAVSVLNNPSFKRRVSYISPTTYQNPNWGTYNTVKAQILQYLTSDNMLQQVRLIVSYAIMPADNNVINNSPSAAATILCGGALQWQTGNNQAQPVIILNVNEFGAPGNNTQLDVVTSLLKGGLTRTESSLVQQGQNPHFADQAKQTQTVFLRRKAYLQTLNAATRFSYVNYPAQLADVQNAVNPILGHNDRVVFIQLGRFTPQLLYYYALFKTNMCSLFEGANSLMAAINMGKPFLALPRTGAGVTEGIYPDTNRGAFSSSPPIGALATAANCLNINLETWPESGLVSSNPCQILAKFFKDITTENQTTGKFHKYFLDIQNFYANLAEDKLNVALAYLMNIYQQDNPENQADDTLALRGDLSQIAAPAEATPINALYDTLKDKVKIGLKLDLIPGVLAAGNINKYLLAFLKSYDASLWMLVEEFTHEGTDGDIKQIALSGTTGVFQSLQVTNSITVIFDQPDTKLRCGVRFSAPGTWSIPGVPWIQMSDPFVQILVSDAQVPVIGQLGGTYQPLKSSLSLLAPSANGQWLVTAAFTSPYPSIGQAFQMAASVNLVQSLPAPLNTLVDIGLAQVDVYYNASDNSVPSLGFILRSNSTQPLPLVGSIALSNIEALVAVTDPVHALAVAVKASGTFTIGTGPDAGLVTVSVQYPNLLFKGSLTSGVIKIADLLAIFVPDISLDPPKLPVITEFDFAYDRQNDLLSVSMALNIDWTFSFLGEDLFTIVEIGFGITRARGANTGFITGTVIILPKSANLTLVVGAFNKGESAWTFSAEQPAESDPLDIDKILDYYLGSGWVPTGISFPKLNGLKVSLDWVDGKAVAWEFAAKTASPWTPIDGVPISVIASLKMGYKSDASGLVRQDTSLAIRRNNVVEEVTGSYAELTANVRLWNIDLTLTYSFNKDAQVVCVQWLFLKACLTKKDGDTIATFTLDNKSIGEMVEMFVSWATGARFGLAAPWNILNSIVLNGFALTYNFTKKKVAFTVNVGPIDLGLFTFKGVSLNYNPDNTDNPVTITVNIDAAWGDGQNLSWDPTKPETTPAPPGGGNKYLDLRLLALGQHVTVDKLVDQTRVEGVIQLLRDLKIPKPPDIPVGGPGQPIFAPQNSWFVAMDFGILKVEDKKPSAQLLPEDTTNGPTSLAAIGADKPPVYFIQLSVVFNDPILYALRIALDGPMAKVFAGLDFQILYRQVAPTVGCYSAQIALPNIMRKFQIGVATITLPIFAIDIYTNGDFQVDIGFPWNQDFTRSFTIEAIIPPGIPVMGSAGFYFGKLSSATTNKVPVVTTGWFNPVIVFGFGAQIGLGKSIEAGILRAGFSVTVFGIIEGVIARWLPYNQPTLPGDTTQLQDGYFFALTGTFGLQGRLYGSIDFAIIKANLDISISIFIRFSFVAYADILIGASVAVRVSLSVEINLGIFSISISFSFSATIEVSFLLKNPMPGPPPWGTTALPGATTLFQRRLKVQDRFHATQLAIAAGAQDFVPTWSNLQPGPALNLQGWVAPVLTVAGDAASTPAEQEVCYVANFFLNTPPPIVTKTASDVALASGNGTQQAVEEHQVAHAALARARRLQSVQAEAQDSSATFDDLVVRVLQWVIAAGMSPMPPDKVNEQVVSDEFLTAALTYLSGATTPTPVPSKEIESFLSGQTEFTFMVNPGSNVSGIFFPAPPGCTLNVPDYNGWQGYNYVFGSYNNSSSKYLETLTTYFNQLKVQVEQESKDKNQADAATEVMDNDGPSIASYIFGDYFALIGRQAIQALRSGLSNFKLPIDGTLTVQQIVKWVNDTGNLQSLPESEQFSSAQLFAANGDHLLNPQATPQFTIAGMTWPTTGGKSFDDISKDALFAGGFDGNALATQNGLDATILAAGAAIKFNDGSTYPIQSADSLDSIAVFYGITLDQLLKSSDVLTNPALIAPLAILAIPQFHYKIVAQDTFKIIAGRFGVGLDHLASANEQVSGLFATESDPNLNIPNLVQFQVGALIDEANRTLALQNLGGMTSRFYLHGLRLPTDGLTANARGLLVKTSGNTFEYPSQLGLFALTGQAFPLPAINDFDPNAPFTFGITRGSNEGWLGLGASGGTSVSFELKDKDDYQRYLDVRNYASTTRLNTEIISLEPIPVAASQPMRFPLSQQIPWQTVTPVVLPRQSVTPETPRPRIWTFPNSLVNLPHDSGVLPRFAPVIARTDQSTSSTKDEDVFNYGFGTMISFSIKKTAAGSASGLSARTYEIIGATEGDIVLLERLLSQVQNRNNLFNQLVLLYRPASTSSETAGFQSDNPASTLMGISQVNLSTETRPPAAALVTENAKALINATLPNVINEPSEFFRLLWEASITRQGGFYLSYTTNIGGADSLHGLPDRIFNDRDTAEIAALALFNVDANPGVTAANYMNAVATNEPFDLTEAALVAKAVPAPLTTGTLTEKDTLAGVADAYYTDPALVASRNSGIAIAGNILLRVSGGSYIVSPDGTNPGGSLDQIASYFSTTAADIKAANPHREQWPDPLPSYTALKLPDISVTIGVTPGGTTFDTLSKYYQAPIAAIAAANQDVSGIFANATLNILAGPIGLSPTVDAGVSGFILNRKSPAKPSSDPTDSNWGRDYLQRIFHLLGYRVACNVDFNQSNWGLPGGPVTTEVAAVTDKLCAPRIETANDIWSYTRTAPYPDLYSHATSMRVSTSTVSPYLGVGSVIQFELAWQDIFGNLILSDLSMPQGGQEKPLNLLPQITGYNDSLLGVGQWPAVASAFRILPDVNLQPSLELQLIFDTAQYLEPGSEDRIRRTLAIYAQIIFQLNDPNGVDLILDTSVIKASGQLLDNTQKQAVITWVENIYLWLESLLPNGKAAPADFNPDLIIIVSLKTLPINPDQIFEVNTTFSLQRRASLVNGELATTSGISVASTSIAPWTGPLADTGAVAEADKRFAAITKIPLADVADQRDLNAFAAAFTAAFASQGGVTYRVATGSPENMFAGSSRTLWAVQLGLPADSPADISYTVLDSDEPLIYAPRPISNKLISRPDVQIIPYTTGKVISDKDPFTPTPFTGVDLDQWMSFTLTQVDALLTPRYVSPALILRQKTGVDSLQKVLDAKRELADALKTIMIPVFTGESPTPGQSQAIQDVFYQSMLALLAQFYAVKAGIQFSTEVHAAIPQTPGTTTPPRLYGDIVGQASSPVANPSGSSNSSLSSPKLNLKFAGDTVKVDHCLTFLLSSTSNEASIDLDLGFQGKNLEQQIGDVPGIEGYQASSWLSFVDDTKAGDWPLNKDLGSFPVPIVLRSFPATPALVNQQAVAQIDSPCYVPSDRQMLKLRDAKLLSCEQPGTYNPLAGITLWNYRFDYSEQVHYQQDTVHGEISFNVSSKTAGLQLFTRPRDLVDNLAEFVQVYPQIQADLDNYLVPLDANTTDSIQIKNAQDALESGAELIKWVAGTAQSQTHLAHDSDFIAANSPYTFSLIERAVDKVNPDGKPVRALEIKVTLEAPLPRTGRPLVEVDPELYQCELNGNDPKVLSFVYRDKTTNDYLPAEEAMNIAGRAFLLPELDILEYQNTQTTISLTRNENLVTDKTTADLFIYTTPEVSLPDALRPTLDNSDPINLATIYAKSNNDPVTRTLECQLTLFYQALFENAGTSDVTLQMSLFYEYTLNDSLQKVRLPVYLMPPVRTAISSEGTGKPLSEIITAQVQGWTNWFAEFTPETLGGTLLFDLTIMSDLTPQPMPLLRLRGLFVPLNELSSDAGVLLQSPERLTANSVDL